MRQGMGKSTKSILMSRLSQWAAGAQTCWRPSEGPCGTLFRIIPLKDITLDKIFIHQLIV